MAIRVDWHLSNVCHLAVRLGRNEDLHGPIDDICLVWIVAMATVYADTGLSFGRKAQIEALPRRSLRGHSVDV